MAEELGRRGSRLQAEAPGLVGVGRAGKLDRVGMRGRRSRQRTRRAVGKRGHGIGLADDGNRAIARFEGDVSRAAVDQVLQGGDGGGKSRR